MAGLPTLPSTHLTGLDVDIVVLATLKSRERMTRRLKDLGFPGTILALPGKDADPFNNSPAVDQQEIKAYENRHINEPAFIIGNGPTLQTTDPRRIASGVTFGCNAIFLMTDFIPDYYCVEDVLVAEDRAKIINGLPWTKFFPADCRQWLNNGIFFSGHRVPEITAFSTDFAKGIQVNATITYTMLQLAYYMGCDPVYLIGLDHSYKVEPGQAERDRNVLKSTADDPNHFHPAYFGKGLRWHDPRLDRMEVAYRFARKAYETAGRKLLNATAGGELEIFERVPFEEVVC